MLTAEDIIKEKGNDIICISSDSTIHEALKIMIAKKIGAILVKDGDEYLGIWTERDLMRNTISDNFDPKHVKVSKFMSTTLYSAPYNATIYSLMDKFLGKHLRHLMIEKGGKYIGMLSAGDVTKAHLVNKTKELEKLNAMVNWDYYEDWKWKKK